MSIQDFFNIDSEVRISKGFLFSCAINLRESTYQVIPNSLLPVLSLSKKKSLNEIAEMIGEEYTSAFFNELVEKKIGIFSQKGMKDKQKNILIKTNDLFVSNVILEINRNNGDYFRQLFNVGTEAIMIIIRNEDDFREEIISCINNCITITSLQILTDFDVFLKYKEHIMSYEKLGLIICANSNENSVEQLNNLNIVKLSKSINEVIKDQSTSPSNFSISKKNYIESLKYNTYLYGKLYVNSHGDVFNSPCSDRLITNIRKDDFSESIREFFYQSSEIKLSNDFCDVCKDCEYRNVCVSARIPVMRGNREGYFEGECNYNPYIGKWDWEIGYSSLSECGVTSDKFGFRIDKKVLKHKIKELWRN